MKFKELAQGSNSDSLAVLGFLLTTFRTLAQSLNHGDTNTFKLNVQLIVCGHLTIQPPILPSPKPLPQSCTRLGSPQRIDHLSAYIDSGRSFTSDALAHFPGLGLALRMHCLMQPSIGWSWFPDGCWVLISSEFTVMFSYLLLHFSVCFPFTGYPKYLDQGFSIFFLLTSSTSA